MHANRYPSTEASAGGIYGRDAVTDEILELGGHPPQTFWLFDDIIQSAYEIDLFGRVHREIEAANANADAVAAARDGVMVVVAAETARAYAAICAFRRGARCSAPIVGCRGARGGYYREASGGRGDSIFDVARAQALVAGSPIQAFLEVGGRTASRALRSHRRFSAGLPRRRPMIYRHAPRHPADRAHPGGRRSGAHQASSRCARGRAPTGRGDRRYRSGYGGAVSHHPRGRN